MNATIAGIVCRSIAILEADGVQFSLDDEGRIHARYPSPVVRKAVRHKISMLRPHRDYVAAYIRCRVHPKVTKMIELFGGTITNIDGEWMAN